MSTRTRTAENEGEGSWRGQGKRNTKEEWKAENRVVCLVGAKFGIQPQRVPNVKKGGKREGRMGGLGLQPLNGSFCFDEDRYTKRTK